MLWEHELHFHECVYNSTETRRKCFLFLLENSPRKITKKEEHVIALFIIIIYYLLSKSTQCNLYIINYAIIYVFLSSY